MRTTWFRRRFYPRYSFDNYDTLAKIVERFKKVETLIINFQDNDLNMSKMKQMDEAFAASGIKTIVFRNLTYFMDIPHLKHYFPKTRSKQSTSFKFIW